MELHIHITHQQVIVVQIQTTIALLDIYVLAVQLILFMAIQTLAIQETNTTHHTMEAQLTQVTQAQRLVYLHQIFKTLVFKPVQVVQRIIYTETKTLVHLHTITTMLMV
jgi:hypothetical protein